MASIRKINGKKGVTYKITVSMGRTWDDKQIRHFKTWKPDKKMTERQADKEAQRVAYEFEKALENGYAADNRQIFSEYARYVIELKERGGAARNTIKIYSNFMKRLDNHIGHLKLSAIRPQHLNNLYKELMQKGEKITRDKSYPLIDFKKLLEERGEGRCAFSKYCGISEDTTRRVCKGLYIGHKSAEKIAAYVGEPCNKLFNVERENACLSASTIHRIHSFISVVLTQAEKEMLIPYNPASRATPPRREYHKPNYFQPEQIAQILEAVEKEPIMWRTMIELMILSGARKGEILALKWRNVDFENKQIKIDSSLSYLPEYGIYEGATKTRNIRFIPLPDPMIDQLKKYRIWQTKRRLMLGDMWVNTDYVFTQKFGGAMSTGAINSYLNKFTEKNGLPHINPHSFRHTTASILIANNVDIVTVAHILGHTTTATTMEVYAHAIEENTRKAAECVSDVILKARKTLP